MQSAIAACTKLLLDTTTVTDSIHLHHCVTVQEFLEWCDRLHLYLQTLENRLFSEGLHILGAPPSTGQMAQYLGAYYGDALPSEAVEVLAEGQGVDRARAALEKAWKQVGVWLGPCHATCCCLLKAVVWF